MSTGGITAASEQRTYPGGWSKLGAVLPVLAFTDMETVDPIVDALLSSGIKALEITLRTPIALDAISHCAKQYPDCAVGAGTVLQPEDAVRVQSAGAQFALSPGLLPEVLQLANALSLPFIPGVTTASEVMQGLRLGVSHFKFFPAIPAGGVETLKAFGGPLPQANFCPTGGVSAENGKMFLDQPNVFAVGMTRLLPKDLVDARDWVSLKRSIKQVLAQLGQS